MIQRGVGGDAAEAVVREIHIIDPGVLTLYQEAKSECPLFIRF